MLDRPEMPEGAESMWLHESGEFWVSRHRRLAGRYDLRIVGTDVRVYEESLAHYAIACGLCGGGGTAANGFAPADVSEGRRLADAWFHWTMFHGSLASGTAGGGLGVTNVEQAIEIARRLDSLALVRRELKAAMAREQFGKAQDALEHPLWAQVEAEAERLRQALIILI